MSSNNSLKDLLTGLYFGMLLVLNSSSLFIFYPQVTIRYSIKYIFFCGVQRFSEYFSFLLKEHLQISDLIFLQFG